MRISRHFALGAALAVVLAMPTLTETVSAPALSLAAKAPGTVTFAKSSTEASLSCSLKAFGGRIVTWVERQVE